VSEFRGVRVNILTHLVPSIGTNIGDNIITHKDQKTFSPDVESFSGTH
jgi:hypothetical protein